MGEESRNTQRDRPRYAALDDYVDVLRRRRLLILICLVLGAGVGVASAASSEDTYTATASLSFRDVAQDLSLFGVDALPEEPLAVRAAVNAELVTRPEVTARVAEEFDGRLTPAELVGAVVARVGSRTQLVILEATAATPELAAEIANLYAQEAARLGRRETSRRLNQVEESLLDELASLESGPSASRPGVGVRISVLESQLSRVQTLQDIAQPVEVVQRAEPPGAPDNPEPLTAGLVGGILGLILGVIVGFTVETLDRRVRTAADLASALGVPVLGRIPNVALPSSGLAGAPDLPPLWEADFEAFRVLRTNLGYLVGEGEPPRVVLVTSSAPGEGKSSVAFGLASAAAIAGQSVLLLEGDLRRPCFAERLGIDRGPGLSEYLNGTASPRDVLNPVPLYAPRSMDRPQPGKRPGTQFAAVTAGATSSTTAELLASERFTELIRQVRKLYDLIVIDSSPLLAVVDPLELFEDIDAALICARAEQVKRQELAHTAAVIANLPERPLGAVLTGVKPGGRDAYDYYGY